MRQKLKWVLFLNQHKPFANKTLYNFKYHVLKLLKTDEIGSVMICDKDYFYLMVHVFFSTPKPLEY